jgi:polyhydroxybutyrate depolymerase
MRDQLLLNGAACALAFLIAASVADRCHAAETIKITHQGVERVAVLHRPEMTQAAPHPLVIALHGLGDTAENFRDWIGFDPTAEREGFAVLYPEALSGLWSYGHAIGRATPPIGDQTVDDIGFIRRLIDDLVARRIADPSRIYAAGTSRGGLMAFTLACGLADRIAAAAVIITGMTEPQRDECRPTRPIPIMVIAGTKDTSQPFGGVVLPFGRLLSVPETINFWYGLHGCTRVDAHPLPHRDETDPTRVRMVEWGGCRTGAKLRLYRIEGGGHQVPMLSGARNTMAEEKFGRRNRDIEAADEIWAFFKGAAP